MKLNKKLELDEKFRKIEKANIIVQKEIIQSESVIISQPMDIDQSNNAAFSDRRVLNNEFMNFEVCFLNFNFFFQYEFIILQFPESTKGMDVNDVNELAEIEALSKKVSNTISNLVVINHLRKPFIFKPFQQKS